ncbi:hypothetical protein LQG66_36345 [Bradyrhizobium ontarionense]|uniref:Uncharacterized protein n=1 Tax=Bradyrhizobium ontarionense TaxID=2898149 RepID=A0ABY3RCW4_9BRAD|nr:hypothetical protein [Bradyrhizobium sp. A19]UFZ04593.1 hypothetical protein LQG66_36345 [Bradyrhizobium sp. A19]
MSELSFFCDRYAVRACVGALPWIYNSYVEHAVLNDDLGIRSTDGTPLFVAVGRDSSSWPELVVSLRFDPGPKSFFYPGILVIPDRDIVLIGAGTTLLAYKLLPLQRLWEDTADCGFWCWRQHGELVLMSAELELAAWHVDGRKLWSTFVEPPWEYEIAEGDVLLDVMGRKSRFNAAVGPARRS